MTNQIERNCNLRECQYESDSDRGSYLACQHIESDIIYSYFRLGSMKGHDVLGIIIGNYLKFSADAIPELRTKISINDFSAVELLSHTLKSSSAQVGAKSLSNHFKDIEHYAICNNLELINEDRLNQIQLLQDEVKLALTYLATNSEEWLNKFHN